jgi:hypothetical protein
VTPRISIAKQLGVRRIEDRITQGSTANFVFNGEMRKLLNRKITSQNRKCALCSGEFTDFGDVVPDHINPRGFGGPWRDDHPDNIQAVRWWCNGEKGSTRI